MFSMQCKAMLFDLDGTLVDSNERIHRLWSSWGRRNHLDVPTVLEVMPGRRAIETIRMLAPGLDAEQELQSLIDEESTDLQGVYPYPGAKELVQSLGRRQWAVVTSGWRRVAEARLRHVSLPIPEVFITGELVSRGKPAPDGFLLAAQKLGLEPRDCVVMEDAPSGIESGKAAGMRVIALSTTQPRAALYQADVIVPGLTALHVEKDGDGIFIRG